jgi:hypothetical protein
MVSPTTGSSTYLDIPTHANAAVRIIKHRYLQDKAPVPIRVFDRLVIESVLYQVFVLTMGLWSNASVLNFSFDIDFWLKCEALLARSIFFPGHSHSYNSPCMGMPLVLFKHMLMIKKLWNSGGKSDRRIVDHLKADIRQWEVWALSLERPPDGGSPTPSPVAMEPISQDATCLTIMSASLLLDQLNAHAHLAGPPQPAAPSDWQFRQIRSILCRRRDDRAWRQSVIGNWPVYTAGFFASSAPDLKLFRDELEGRWLLINFSQVDRFRTDLETVWTERGLLPSAVAPANPNEMGKERPSHPSGT